MKSSAMETLRQGGQGRSCFAIQMMRSSEGRVFVAENNQQNSSRQKQTWSVRNRKKAGGGAARNKTVRVCADTSYSEGVWGLGGMSVRK